MPGAAKTIVEHDPCWGDIHCGEAAQIRRRLGAALVAVHHIGSTAIPGIVAKPTIDILIEATSLAEIDRKTHELAAQGYDARGEYGIIGRRYFTRLDPTQGVRGFHVHAFRAGDPLAVRHMLFCDRLRALPDLARAYGALKQSLAGPGGVLPDDYAEHKSDFIRAVVTASSI